jgi:lipopolysaccharide/colanic/teichoic acid biosynthesis glycosyltransferase
MLVSGKKPKNAHRKKSHVNHPPDGHIRVATDVQQSRYFRVKDVIERVAAALLLLLGLPLIGLLMLLVRLTSRGPGIYRQARLGRNAKVFYIYKIRTMRQDAEEKTGPVWAKPHDVRVTSLGRFLRKVHLDELPQLINVAKGEMSLIGPRPERPEIAAVLVETISGYSDRMAVLPGVTGLAQINLPPDSTEDDVRRKLLLDMKYIRQAGFWLDARILMSTFVRLIGLPGAWAMVLFGLRCPEVHGHEPASSSRPPETGEAATAIDGNGNGRPNIAPKSGNGRSDGMKATGVGKPHTEVRKPR